MSGIEMILDRLREGKRTRILAFGSSNTERHIPGLHWLDWLELAIRCRYGRVHTMVNTGIGGDTTGMLLARFDDDAARYCPHLAIVTAGGNDSFPQNGVTLEAYRANLLELHRRFAALGTTVLFQTYYAPDPDLIPGLERFYACMEAVREVAGATQAGLADHLARWEPFRRAHTALYKTLMLDGFHVNALGNAVLGADLARRFQADLGGPEPDVWADALRIQRLMDAREDGRGR